MPFGICAAPVLAGKLTASIVMHLKSKGFTVVGYLHYFMILAREQEECQEAYDYLIYILLPDLGIPVNEAKCVDPTRARNAGKV